MVDADDPAIGRVDEATDPAALSEDEIKRELSSNPNLSGEAVRAFAEEVSNRRQAVREEGQQLLSKRFASNPANAETIQLRDSKGRLSKAIPDEGSVDLDIQQSGDVYADLPGDRVHLGEIDVNAGASGQRKISRYSKKRHPAQKRGGGS